MSGHQSTKARICGCWSRLDSIEASVSTFSIPVKTYKTSFGRTIGFRLKCQPLLKPTMASSHPALLTKRALRLERRRSRSCPRRSRKTNRLRIQMPTNLPLILENSRTTPSLYKSILRRLFCTKSASLTFVSGLWSATMQSSTFSRKPTCVHLVTNMIYQVRNLTRSTFIWPITQCRSIQRTTASTRRATSSASRHWLMS